MGIRTASEIDAERYALKVIRGDFLDVPGKNDELNHGDISRILEAVNR